MSRIIHVLLITSVVFSGGYAFARSPDTPKEFVEVVAGGKIYPSVHAYKLQKLKDDLRGVLSPGQLREFSEEELSAVIREIQFQPPAMAQLPAPEVTAPAADEQIGQMEEMLEDYTTRHGDVPPLEGRSREGQDDHPQAPLARTGIVCLEEFKSFFKSLTVICADSIIPKFIKDKKRYKSLR